MLKEARKYLLRFENIYLFVIATLSLDLSGSDGWWNITNVACALLFTVWYYDARVDRVQRERDEKMLQELKDNLSKGYYNK